ncbi:hypothetical protein BV20DRAFT_1115636 [Pilatotrama ljubarskyi]|nr:hypothetical protein BV20DRAFT_1115636 [Pilatotrama ljubarskyi]
MDHDVETRKISTSIDHYHNQARLVARIVHPFMSPFEALTFGIEYDGPGEIPSDDESEPDLQVTGEDSDAGARVESRRAELAHQRELLYQYQAIFECLPDLKTYVEFFDGDSIRSVGAYLQFNMNAARGDDSNRMRESTIAYMQSHDHEGYSKAPSTLAKFQRGWRNWYTARLLCPQRQLAAFDRDWEQFSAHVMSATGGIEVRGGDFPAFMYSQASARPTDNPDSDDPGTMLAGFLMSTFLVMCYKRLWTGPSSVALAYGRKLKTPGKPPLSQKYKIYRVSPRTLAYTVVLIRAELSSQGAFGETDVGAYNGSDLFNSIVEQLEDDTNAWGQDTLRWWNARVFGNMTRTEPQVARELTTADRLRAARRRNKDRAAAQSSQAPSASSSSATAPAAHAGTAD